MNRFDKLFYSDSSHYQTLIFIKKSNKFHILQSFDKDHKIVVLHRYHENADKSLWRYCQYFGEETKLYRNILRKWYVYKWPASVFNYNPTIYDLYLPQNITNADILQIDDKIISCKHAFDKINNLLKPSADIWNNNEKAPIWKEQLRLPWQTFVESVLENYRKKLVNDFTEKSFFLFDKSNLIKELFIIEITKLISVYGSISYFGKKVNKIHEIISSNEPLKLHVKKDTIKSL